MTRPQKPSTRHPIGPPFFPTPKESPAHSPTTNPHPPPPAPTHRYRPPHPEIQSPSPFSRQPLDAPLSAGYPTPFPRRRKHHDGPPSPARRADTAGPAPDIPSFEGFFRHALHETAPRRIGRERKEPMMTQYPGPGPLRRALHLAAAVLLVAAPLAVVSPTAPAVAAPEPEPTVLDIAILVDLSGSIRPEDLAREVGAAKRIASGALSDRTRVSVHGFGGQRTREQHAITEACPPRVVDSAVAINTLSECLDDLARPRRPVRPGRVPARVHGHGGAARPWARQPGRSERRGEPVLVGVRVGAGEQVGYRRRARRVVGDTDDRHGVAADRTLRGRRDQSPEMPECAYDKAAIRPDGGGCLGLG